MGHSGRRHSEATALAVAVDPGQHAGMPRVAGDLKGRPFLTPRDGKTGVSIAGLLGRAWSLQNRRTCDPNHGE
jgi:hypothetical protein